jgi:hypothetical protein
MKRTILTTLAATALLAIPACKGGASAAGGKLIPEQATIMAGIDVGGLLKSKLYADNKAIAESQAGYKEVVEAAKGCNLDPEKAITSVLVGTDAKDGVAVVITGTGIGDEKNLTCVKVVTRCDRVRADCEQTEQPCLPIGPGRRSPAPDRPLRLNALPLAFALDEEIEALDLLASPGRLAEELEAGGDARLAGEAADGDALAELFPAEESHQVADHGLEGDAVQRIFGSRRRRHCSTRARNDRPLILPARSPFKACSARSLRIAT